MPNAEIRLVFKDNNIPVHAGSNFSSVIKTKGIYCAELDPPILLEDGSLKHINFSNFCLSNKNESILFYVPNDVDVSLPKNITKMTLKIVSPKPVPLLESLNPKLMSPREQFFAHVFFLPHMKDNIDELQYLSSISSSWNDLSENLKSILEDAQKGFVGLSVGILEIPNVLPRLQTLNTFFESKESFKKGRAVMIIIVSSFQQLTFKFHNEYVSVENLPKIPKDVIMRIASGKKNFNAIERRVIKSCLNGGVPVHCLDNLEDNPSLKSFGKLKSADFDQVELFLGNIEKVTNDIVEKLGSTIEDSKDHLFSTSSEAALRSLFWDSTLNRMVQNGLEGKLKNFNIEPEWETRSLLKEHIKQKVDYTVTFELNGTIYPMLLVEIGKEPFDLNNPHKDQSKLLGLVSQTCINLAYALIKAKKQPEMARTCGIWIGGLRAQLIVAHPVITKLATGEFEIHSNVSIQPHWLFDLTCPSEFFYSEYPCNPAASEGSVVFEYLKTGDLNLDEYRFVPEITVIEELALSEPEPGVKLAKTKPAEKTKLIKGEINTQVLKIINFFIQFVKSRINLILSQESNSIDDTRIFKKREKIGVLVRSRESSLTETPAKQQLSLASTETGLKSPLKDKGRDRKRGKGKAKFDGFCMEKNSFKELEILLKLSMFPNNFPIVLDYEIETTEQDSIIYYEFEEMTWIFDTVNETLSPELHYEHPIDTFCACINFVLDCVYSLYLLHEIIGVIHSDISPNNIMFSSTTNSWKIIDFDQSLEISESLRTTRRAGTSGYIAPEAQESGIFTKESDVFSLGKVFVHEITEEIRSMGGKYCSIIRRMTHQDPSSRPSTIQVLEEVFEIAQKFRFLVEITNHPSIKMLLRQKNNLVKIQEKLEKVHVQESVSLDPKRARITEEKEQAYSTTQTIQ